MYLKALEMQGFKSFPDKTVLEFGKGMTAVVGPNGSGKSNISDAVRWVLGEQSTKSLRGAKMEDVIFSGTSTRRSYGYAEVTLRLDNTDGALKVDSPEVAVTRRFYRSGESAYIINGESVRLKDVHELFMDTGLGRDGYSMVSQGRIEDMVSAKSTERRDMFEEAAGISHYRYRRNEATHRLDMAEENLVRLRDIVTELASRVGPLEQQSEKAQKFLTLAEEKKTVEIGLWLDVLSRSNGLIREQNDKLTTVTNRYDEVSKQLDDLFASMDEKANRSREITQKIDDFRSRAALFDEQASELDAQSAVYENTVMHNNETVQRITRDRDAEEQIIREITEKLNEERGMAQEIRESIRTEKDNLEKTTAQLDSLQSRDSEYSEEYGEVSTALSDIILRLSRFEVMSGSAKSSVDEINTRLEAIEQIITEREKDRDELAKKAENEEKALQNAEEKASSLSNMMSGCTLKLKNRLEKSEKLKQDYENKKLTLSAKNSRLHFLEDTEKSMEGYQGSVKAVMKEFAHGGLRGIRGTLSQLISVEDEYATAIETALGNAIQDIVTENENDAKRAIYFLKESNVGRATFLPLTAIRGRGLEEKGLEGMNGFVSLAPALVECDAEYREIIENLLGKTAVASDLDAAVDIAKKYGYRFKIVTLDGQVVNAGGSMSGGSKTPGASFLSRANEIEKLRQECSQLENDIKQTENDAKKAKEDYLRERADAEGIQGELLAANEEKMRLSSALELTRGKISDAVKTLESLAREKAEAAERTAFFAENMAIAAKESEKLYSEKEKTEEKLREISGGRDSLIAERDRIGSQISEINMRIMASIKEADAKDESAESHLRRTQSHEQKRDELNKEIENIKKNNEQTALRAASGRESAKALRSEAASERGKTEQLIAEREQYETDAGESRNIQRTLNDEREKLSAEKVRLEERKNSLEREAGEIDQKLYEEYSLTRGQAQELNIEIESASKAQRRLSELKSQIRTLGSVNVAAIEEYKEVSERYTFLSEQVEDVEKSRAELLKLISELTESMATRFRERFDIINKSFSDTFTELFSGGSATLVLEDENDILECGIEIKAQPPGKNVKSLSLLSGGEKGLCAIALLFAILKVTPSPFCIFDEVEAALDDINVLRFAQYVRMMTGRTQFILITHRRGTMEEADILYGVTMQEEGVSKLLELKTAEMARKLGLEQ